MTEKSWASFILQIFGTPDLCPWQESWEGAGNGGEGPSRSRLVGCLIELLVHLGGLKGGSRDAQSLRPPGHKPLD